MSTVPDFDTERELMFHPYNILLTLLMMGITSLFLAFSAAYVYTRVQNPDIPPIKLPLMFFFNTFILVGSSFTINLAKKAYLEDRTNDYQKALLYTIILSFLFLVAQFYAWWTLFQDEIFINYSNMASYVYVISWLHFMHVIAGLPFLVIFLYKAKKFMVEPVSVLIYFSDPTKRLKLKLLTRYWHYLDALWIYLILFFLVNYFVQ